MEPIEIALSFLISYIAGNVPSIKDILEINSSLEDKLESCFKKAVDDWNIDPDTKKSAQKNMPLYLIKLKEYLSHAPKGHHPKENELLKLWSRYIISDKDCSAFILKYQNDIIQMDINRGFQRAGDILNDIRSEMNEEFQRIQEKLDRLLKRGVSTAEYFWNCYSTIDTNKKLVPSTILCGREKSKKKIESACNTPSLVNIEAGTRKEAIAFVCAAVIMLGENYVKKAYVVEDVDSYRELSTMKTPLIIITSLLENHAVAVNSGHTVFCCVSHQSRLQNTEILGELDRESFVQALNESGYDDAQARVLARDSSRDINNLWRSVGIVNDSPSWESNDKIRILIPAMLLGEWNEVVKNDCDLVSQMADMSYDEYKRELQPIIMAEESPLKAIGGIWKIRSPYNLMCRFYRDITESDIKRFLTCVDWIIEDDDPDAVNKRDAEEFKFWKDKHAFSGNIRNGVFQGITILSLLQEENGDSNELIRSYLQKKLENFGLVRYLSNRNYLQLVAEAVPAVFLEYVESNMKDGSDLLKEIFEVKKRKYDIVDTSIYYTDLLFCLESLAWDEKLLPVVSDILLYLCRYPNDSNWANKPINSLLEIFRFQLPQTYASFDHRMAILKNLSQKYPEDVRTLCLKELKRISNPVFCHTSSFKWRWMERQNSPKYIDSIPSEHVQQMVDLMLSVSRWTDEDICEYIELSSTDYMHYSRECLLSAICEHKEQMEGNELIVECLRKDINRHRSCRKAKWALSAEELKPFKDLLSEIESQDLIQRSKHCFDEVILDDLDFDTDDYEIRSNKTLNYRVSIIGSILDANGLDGIFTLSNIVGQSSTVAEALVGLSKEKYVKDVYRKWTENAVPPQFVRSYFLRLYFIIGQDDYLQIISELYEMDAVHIAVVLYAPEFKKELAEKAENFGEDVIREYWENVTLWHLSESDIALALMRLKEADRYEDILQMMTYGNLVTAFSQEDKITFLFDMFKRGIVDRMVRRAYNIAELLKSIELPVDKKQKDGILMIEFLMFNQLRHYMQDDSYHLIKEVKSSPELMIELVDLLYLPDEGFKEKEPDEKLDEQKANLARLAFDFFYNYHAVPGLSNDGTLDYEVLNSYIDRLYELSKFHHREHVMPIVVGRIIGDIPEGENYPSTEMCELVERMADDKIDSEISCAIANRRGMSSRSPFEGGTIERGHIETLKGYRDKAFGKSPRMVKILSDEIRNFETMAKREDEQAELTKMKY